MTTERQRDLVFTVDGRARVDEVRLARLVEAAFPDARGGGSMAA